MPQTSPGRRDAFRSTALLGTSAFLFAWGLAFWQLPRFFPVFSESSMIPEAALYAGVLVGATGLVPVGFWVALSLARLRRKLSERSRPA